MDIYYNTFLVYGVCHDVNDELNSYIMENYSNIIKIIDRKVIYHNYKQLTSINPMIDPKEKQLGFVKKTELNRLGIVFDYILTCEISNIYQDLFNKYNVDSIPKLLIGETLWSSYDHNEYLNGRLNIILPIV